MPKKRKEKYWKTHLSNSRTELDILHFTKSFLNKQKRNISLILEEMTVFSLVMITVIQEQGNDAKADSETVHFMYLIKCMCPLFSCC